jgi:hypothetical protein
MNLCPDPIKIQELTEELNSSEDAYKVWVLSNYDYPSLEQAQKILNMYNTKLFETDFKAFQRKIALYNTTNKGKVTNFNKEDAIKQKAYYESLGFTVSKVGGTSPYFFNLDKPIFQYSNLYTTTRLDFFNGDIALYEQELKEVYNKTKSKIRKYVNTKNIKSTTT